MPHGAAVYGIGYLDIAVSDFLIKGNHMLLAGKHNRLLSPLPGALHHMTHEGLSDPLFLIFRGNVKPEDHLIRPVRTVKGSVMVQFICKVIRIGTASVAESGQFAVLRLSDKKLSLQVLYLCRKSS